MKKEKICGIYEIKNLINNKVYIGSSVNIIDRWNTHKRDLNKNRHHSTHLQRSWEKYGSENFKFTILETVECKDDLLEREQYWIDLKVSFEFEYGYNGYMNSRGPSGHKYSRDVILKSKVTIPVLQIDLNGNIVKEWYGAREASKLLNIKQDCIWACCHHKRKTYKGFIWIFKNEYEIKFDLNDYYNKTASKVVCQYDLEGNLIKIWDTLRIASKYFEVDNSYLSKCCRKDLKCKNYKWKYYEDIISN